MKMRAKKQLTHPNVSWSASTSNEEQSNYERKLWVKREHYCI